MNDSSVTHSHKQNAFHFTHVQCAQILIRRFHHRIQNQKASVLLQNKQRCVPFLLSIKRKSNFNPTSISFKYVNKLRIIIQKVNILHTMLTQNTIDRIDIMRTVYVFAKILNLLNELTNTLK